MPLTVANPAPVARGARSHEGLRPRPSAAEDAPEDVAKDVADTAAFLMPSLIALKPCAVLYFSPLRGARACSRRGASRMGMPLNSDMGPLYLRLLRDFPPLLE